METIPAVEVDVQVSSVPEVRPSQKVGVEIVRSAGVSRRHYFGPRPGRRSSPTELSQRDRFTILRGQLRLLRLRAERGIFVTPDSIARAERLASSLEAAA